jgi:hypothetical protein
MGGIGSLPVFAACSAAVHDREILRARRKEEMPYQAIKKVQKPAITKRISSPVPSVGPAFL